MKSKKKVLILGGTEFVGRQLVEELIHLKSNEVYLFNRGKTNPELFPNVKRIIGDRETSDIEQISEYKWDYVIDFSSYFPNSLEQTLLHINKDVKKYIYISTISVYSFPDYDSSFEIGEDFKKRSYEKKQLCEPSLKFYGEKKAACEDILTNTDWLNSIIIRPSIIYGKFDPTDRLYYWIERIKNKEKIIVPANGEASISLTYSSDLVRILMNCLDDQLSNGVYNCVSNKPNSFRVILELIKDTLNSDCEFVPIDQDKLRAEKLSGNDFPLWIGGNLMIDNSKIMEESNMEFTSLKASIQATIRHYEEQEWQTPKIGITYEAEDRLIEQFRA